MTLHDVWPEWQEERLLGKGANGQVYLAKREELGKTFYSAVKILSVSSSEEADKLINEIDVMEKLKGAKNIVGIDDHKIVERKDASGWDIFIRMEYLTCFDSFDSKRDYSRLDVLRLGIDLCSALEICEENHIIHRDIKPGNIFVSKFGEYKLGDFGEAMQLENSGTNFTKVGTLNYMAPEVYRGEPYGTSVDQYSVGLVLYGLLNNNRLPFFPPWPREISYNDQVSAFQRRVCSGEQIELPCNARDSLGAAILRAIAFRSTERYPKAKDFKIALLREQERLARSGGDQAIGSDGADYSPEEWERGSKTTRDMSINGQILVAPNDTTGVRRELVGPEAPLTRGNKPCRILSRFLSPGLFALGYMLLMRAESGQEVSVALALSGLGLVMLVSNHNHVSIGLLGLSLSLVYLTEGSAGLFFSLHEEIPVEALTTLISGLLMLFGGLLLLFRRQPGSGGAAFLYAFGVKAFYTVYHGIYYGYTLNLWQISIGVASFAIFLWALGYDCREENTGIDKALEVSTVLLAGAVTLTFLTSAARFIYTIVEGGLR